MIFPDFSDFSTISDTTRMTWESEISLRNKYRNYFDGGIFEQKIPSENGIIEEDAPLLYPVGLNLVKMLCVAQTDSLFGEWEDTIVTLDQNDDEKLDNATTEAIKILNQVLEGSSINTLLWELDLDRNVYGGGVMKIAPAINERGRVRWYHIPLDSFCPIFDPDDANELLEVYVVTQMTNEQAAQKYGIVGTGAIVQRVEHWTRQYYDCWINGQKISEYSGVNPWGFIPYVYIPRIRTHSWFGDALTADLMDAQDELNIRMADLGDAITYNSHPTRWGRDMSKGFTGKNFEVGVNTLWDLGRSMGERKPEVGMLEAKNPLPAGVFEYLKFVYDWARTSVSSPPIAFGEDNGGGQRSGATLEIRMWPLLKAVRRSRSYMLEGINRAIRMTALMYKQKAFNDILPTPVKAMLDGKVVPHMASIMPKDHAAVVDEVTKLMSTTPRTISLPMAIKQLGRGAGEVQRIREMIEDEILCPKAPEPVKADPLNKPAKVEPKKSEAE